MTDVQVRVYGSRDEYRRDEAEAARYGWVCADRTEAPDGSVRVLYRHLSDAATATWSGTSATPDDTPAARYPPATMGRAPDIGERAIAAPGGTPPSSPAVGPPVETSDQTKGTLATVLAGLVLGGLALAALGAVAGTIDLGGSVASTPLPAATEVVDRPVGGSSLVVVTAYVDQAFPNEDANDGLDRSKEWTDGFCSAGDVYFSQFHGIFGTDIEVRNEDGRMIGVGHFPILGTEDEGSSLCTFSFEIPLQGDATFYAFDFGIGGEVTKSRSELEQQGWNLTFFGGNQYK